MNILSYNRLILIGPLAIILCVSEPVGAMEKVQEVETSEENRICYRIGNEQTQKPANRKYISKKTPASLDIDTKRVAIYITPKKYLLYCNFTFYD